MNIPRSPLAAGHCPVEVSEWPPLTGCGVSSEHTDRVLSLEESCWEGSRGSCASRGQEQCSQTSLVPRPSPGGRAPGSWRLQSAQGVRKCGSGWGTGSEPDNESQGVWAQATYLWEASILSNGMVMSQRRVKLKMVVRGGWGRGSRETSHAAALQGSVLRILPSKPRWRDPAQILAFLRHKCGLRLCSCSLGKARRLLRASAQSPGVLWDNAAHTGA